MLTTIAEFFAFGTIAFWGLVIVFLAVMIGCIHNESPGWSIFWLGLAVFLYWKHLPSWSVREWVMFSVAYLALGVVWSLIKWKMFVKTQVAKFKSDWDARDKHSSEYRAALKDAQRNTVSTYHKGAIYTWIAYWPLSILWAVINDFTLSLLRNIHYGFRKFYASISSSAWKEV